MLADVESRTGKPVELRPEPQLDGRARGTYAVSDPDRSRHLLLYDPAKIDLLDHIVPHELGHVEMFESADPAGRLVPVVVEQDRQLARKNLLRELVATRRVLPSTSVSPVTDLWIDGTVGQLANFPADIAIEQDLWRLHPELRGAQRRALELTAVEGHEALQPQVVEYTPETVLTAVNSMNYAFLKSVSRFLGQPWMVRPYEKTPYKAVGEDLLSMFAAGQPATLAGGISISADWAARLGVKEWVRWMRVDRVAPNAGRLWTS